MTSTTSVSSGQGLSTLTRHPGGVKRRATHRQVSGRIRATGAAFGLAALVACDASFDSSAPEFSNPSLPSARLGEPYTAQLRASGGSSPYEYSVTSGSLPQGLDLSGDTISGMPENEEDAQFTLRVTGGKSRSSERRFRIKVSKTEPLVLTTASLLPGTVGEPYQDRLDANGGDPPYGFRVASGALPSGVLLDGQTGALSGTPTTAGSSEVVFEAADANGRVAQAAFDLVIAPRTQSSALMLSTTSLPVGTEQQPYSAQLSATGGMSPYVFRSVGGSLPSGLVLDAQSGSISGTPVQSGSFPLTFEVVDTASATAQASMVMTIAVPPLAITTTSLPSGTVGQVYQATFSATGGQPPYSFSITSGRLPTGLTLDQAGTLSGTPAEEGTFALTVEVLDSAGGNATADMSLSIGPEPLAITTSSLPVGTEGQAYSARIDVSGGVSPFSFRVVSGSLPSGISLDSQTGALSGTPSQPASSEITFEASDAAAQRATATLTLTVAAQSSSQTTIVLSPSRTSGVAPLTVFFDASRTTSTSQPKSFHHLHYAWDFADPSSRRPEATGPLAAHVFETPGTYAVTLAVTAPDEGTVVDTVSITVDDPDVVFSGSNTVCFSSSGNFAGAPAGAQQVTTSSFDTVMQSFGSGKRLLLRRGDTFNSTQSHSLGGVSSQAVIGAFGAGQNPDERGIYANNPVVVCGAAPFSGGVSDVTVMDLVLEPAGAEKVLDASPSERILFLRLAADGFPWPFSISHDVVQFYQSDPHDHVFFADCRLENARDYMIYCGGERFAFLGNKLSRVTVEHVLRITFARDFVIAGNEISYSPSSKLILKLHAAQNTSRYGQYTERIVVCDNEFRSASNWGVVAGPQNSTSDERIRDVIFERNTVIGESGNRIGLRVNASDTTLRNNLILAEGASDMLGITVSRLGVEPTPTGVEVFHNTAYSSRSGSGMTVVKVEQHAGSPLPVQNNLIHAPNMGSATVVTGGGSYMATNNLSGVDPLFVDPASGNFALQVGSPAVDAGADVPVLDDASGRSRVGEVPDLGCHEGAN